MQFNRVMKVLMLVTPTVTLAACGLHKSTNNGVQSTVDAGTDTGINMNDGNTNTLSSNELLQMQELQRNNIVYFDLDQYDIRFEFAQMLDDQAGFLRTSPSRKVIIEGHADERGTSEYNIALGERRANALKMYLQSKGVADDQITIVSYGKEKPAVLGHSEAAYAKNRRAILLYTKDLA